MISNKNNSGEANQIDLPVLKKKIILRIIFF
jgi:hypothetical protein